MAAQNYSTNTGLSALPEYPQEKDPQLYSELIYLRNAIRVLQGAIDGISGFGGAVVSHSVGPLANNAVVIGNGFGDIRTLGSLGTLGFVLTSQGPAADPVWLAAAGGSSGVTAVAIVAGSITIDQSLTPGYRVAMNANAAMANPISPVTGGRYYVRFIQDATGNRTITSWGSKWAADTGSFPVLSTKPNIVDGMLVEYDATDDTHHIIKFFAGYGFPTGGIKTTRGIYSIHTYPAGTEVVFESHSFAGTVNYVIQAGGGPGSGTVGGSDGPGGGGAGENLTGTFVATTSTRYIGSAGYGALGINAGIGVNGDNSVFNAITALGGGYGGGGPNVGPGIPGGAGGNGGGAGGGAAVAVGGVSTGSGFAGGNSNASSPAFGGGGGGGQGGAGVIGTNTNGGNGGIGVTRNIAGVNKDYAGGGGGGNFNIGGGGGGSASFGGGHGRVDATNGDNAINGTGGGGGGAGSNAGAQNMTGGNGGDGEIVLWYITP